MRVVFCGTPEFSVPALNALVRAGMDVPLVVSRPDRVRGRRQEPTPSPVRARALELGIETAVLEKGRRAALYEKILSCAPEVVVVVAFGHIVREPLLHGARLGCVNVHASLLPRWRGPAPIHTAVVAGDSRTGVCTMKLAEGVDTGDVFDVASCEIGSDETAGELHDRLSMMGGELLSTTLERLGRGELEATPQPEVGVTHAPMLEKAEGSIDFTQPARRVHDRVRGLDPWPGTTVRLGEARLKLAASRLSAESAPASAVPGTVVSVDARGMLIACGEGCVRIGQVQAEGRRRVSAEEFARGHALEGGLLRPLEDFRPRQPRA